jgi:hypothetical protein
MVSVNFIQLVDGVYTENSVAYVFRDGMPLTILLHVSVVAMHVDFKMSRRV